MARTRLRFDQMKHAPIEDNPIDLGDRKHFALHWLPLPETLVVWVNDQRQIAGKDYSLCGNVIVFKTPKASTAHIEANYLNIWNT